jgi:RNA recognition motif-containing protein
MMQGFCFVNTLSVEGAMRAMAALQGSRLHGNIIRINFAKDKYEGRPQPSQAVPKPESKKDVRIQFRCSCFIF